MLFPILIFLFYAIVLGIIFFVLFLINKWVTNSISVKREQNELLRELIKVIDTNRG